MCLSSLAYIGHFPAPHRRAVTPDRTVGAEASQTPQAARQSPPSLRLLLSPLFHTSHLPSHHSPHRGFKINTIHYSDAGTFFLFFWWCEWESSVGEDFFFLFYLKVWLLPCISIRLARGRSASYQSHLAHSEGIFDTSHFPSRSEQVPLGLLGTKGKQQAGATLKVVGRSRTADFTLAALSPVLGSDKKKRPVACEPAFFFVFFIDTLLLLSEKAWKVPLKVKQRRRSSVRCRLSNCFDVSTHLSRGDLQTAVLWEPAI